MNKFAYRTTGLAIKTLSSLSRAKVHFYGKENLSASPAIYVLNHFTRIETLLMPYHINRLTNQPVWSLASAEFFNGSLGPFLEKVGAVSTKAPDRDRLIVKSLLTGEASWIIFPEGRMVKSKKIIEKGRYIVSYAGGKHPPHTGAATLALRTEFYRQRIKQLALKNPQAAFHLATQFNIDSLEMISDRTTVIVPINLTYYPMRAKENILSKLAFHVIDDIPERMIEEIMTEGSMLLSGVDIDIRVGRPIPVQECLSCRKIFKDISEEDPFGPDAKIPSLVRMRKEAVKLMQRYMAAIYAMTTVNHDHLFASAIKHSPSRRIDIENLKRRVFLCAGPKIGNLGVHLHQSLTTDQTHLLIDDRFEKFADFISLAEEKKVVRVQGLHLVKDRQKLSSMLDFHRVRIDNPIAVIANEVEPLTLLQRRMARLACLPGFWLRRKVVRYLIQQALAEYDADYEHFFIESESKPKAVGRPYLIKGRSKALGIILCHGYMASPLEVRQLAEYLGRRGYWVYVPRLKGHGTSPEDLAIRRYQDWITSVDHGYAIIRNICRRVVAGGFSTGAGLALELSSRVDDLAGVFAVSTPLRLQDFSVHFVPAVDTWNWIMNVVRLDEAKKKFVDNHPENPHINYLRNPVSGVRELERLMDVLEAILPKIKIPTLVVQSNKDPVVDPKGAERIFRLLGAEDKKLVMYNFPRHGILLGEGAHRVHRTIGQFIDHLK